MYRPTRFHHSRPRHSGNMLLKNLPSPRWVLFGLIAAGYFLFTIYILSYSQEPCTKSGQKLPDLTKHEALASSGLRTPVKEVTDEIELNHDNQILNVDTKVTGKSFNLGPMGEKIALKPKKVKPDVSLFSPDILSPEQLLHPDLTPNMVYMVWCGRRWFEFHHYMSVLSVIKHLKPDNMIFYYNKYPILDRWLYNTWIDEIKAMYPFFHTQELVANSGGCGDGSLPNITFIENLLRKTGGMYLNENTILVKYPYKLRHYDYVYALDKTNMYGFMTAKRGLTGKNSITTLLADKKFNSTEISCGGVNAYNQAKRVPMCIITTEVFYPKDIWDDQSKFSQLIRTLFYGNPMAVDSKPSYDELIPNIAHVVWLGGGRMDYLFYLGVLSLLYVAEVDVVYIHGDAPPAGDLWQRIKDNPRIKLIYREAPKTIYGQKVNVISHVTDIWRVDFMIRYGGIYVDTDTVWVKKFDHTIRGYDAVASYDWTDWNPPFPDTINFGVSIGKRNAPYWHEFQKTMKWFIDDDWSWNGLRQPYKVKERHPDLLRIDPHLAAICFNYLCHPTWWPNYHNESIHHMNSASIRDWRNDVYAFHWTLPTPPELDNEELLMTSQTMAAEMGRNVLAKAGLLKEIRDKYAKKKTAKPNVNRQQDKRQINDADRLNR